MTDQAPATTTSSTGDPTYTSETIRWGNLFDQLQTAQTLVPVYCPPRVALDGYVEQLTKLDIAGLIVETQPVSDGEALYSPITRRRPIGHLLLRSNEGHYEVRLEIIQIAPPPVAVHRPRDLKTAVRARLKVDEFFARSDTPGPTNPTDNTTTAPGR